MKLRCVKCEIVKELTPEELKEVGEFVSERKLRAVHFLKYLSMDLREVCKDGRNHEYEFDSSFDKEVHEISIHCRDTEKVKINNVSDMQEYTRMIIEYENKRDLAAKKADECADIIVNDKMKLRQIAYIDDPGLWSEKE